MKCYTSNFLRFYFISSEYLNFNNNKLVNHYLFRFFGHTFALTNLWNGTNNKRASSTRCFYSLLCLSSRPWHASCRLKICEFIVGHRQEYIVHGVINVMSATLILICSKASASNDVTYFAWTFKFFLKR